MVSRIVLNTISYHGKGAIEKIPEELQARGYKKAFVCSDPDLLKFGVTQKVTEIFWTRPASRIPFTARSSRTRRLRTYSTALRPSRFPAQTAS